MRNIGKLLRVLAVSALFVMALALPAGAGHDCDDPGTAGTVEVCTQQEEIGDSLATAATDGKTVLSDNMPLVFGVAVAFVAWRIGRRVLGKI